ncbi:MAG: tRNA dihydrouridine synthase DusB, partial [Bdellovibrionales bacterium]
FDQLLSHLTMTADAHITALQIKKMAVWYSSGFAESSAFRKNVFALKDLDEVMRYIKEYFQSKSSIQQKDTSDEAFLMGGHG